MNKKHRKSAAFEQSSAVFLHNAIKNNVDKLAMTIAELYTASVNLAVKMNACEIMPENSGLTVCFDAEDAKTEFLNKISLLPRACGLLVWQNDKDVNFKFTDPRQEAITIHGERYDRV